MSNDQLSLIYLADIIIHNMENVRPTRYSLLHIDEAMNIYKITLYKDVITLNKYILYYLTSTFPIIFVVSN